MALNGCFSLGDSVKIVAYNNTFVYLTAIDKKYKLFDERGIIQIRTKESVYQLQKSGNFIGPFYETLFIRENSKEAIIRDDITRSEILEAFYPPEGFSDILLYKLMSIAITRKRDAYVKRLSMKIVNFAYFIILFKDACYYGRINLVKFFLEKIRRLKVKPELTNNDREISFLENLYPAFRGKNWQQNTLFTGVVIGCQRGYLDIIKYIFQLLLNPLYYLNDFIKEAYINYHFEVVYFLTFQGLEGSESKINNFLKEAEDREFFPAENRYDDEDEDKDDSEETHHVDYMDRRFERAEEKGRKEEATRFRRNLVILELIKKL